MKDKTSTCKATTTNRDNTVTPARNGSEAAACQKAESELLELAIGIALKAHAGQLDKGGQAYILHPLHVMLQMKTPREMMAAVLHDVVEDTSITLDDLAKAGLPGDVIEAVDLLTRGQGVSHAAYLRELLANNLARRVKRADLRHNIDITRLARVTGDDLPRLRMYRKGLDILASHGRAGGGAEKNKRETEP